MASLDIGIDLGTSNMIAGNRTNGIIVNEPTIVAANSKTGKIIGVGRDVKAMVGREHGKTQLYYPMENGVISDYRMTGVLTKYLFKKVGKSLFFKPRVIACVPCGVTYLEAQSMIDILEEAGARHVQLMQEPVAAAMGVGMAMNKARGNLILDIGGGTTDVAILSMGGVVSAASTHFAGNSIDEAIVRHLRNAHNMIIGTHTAEQVKIQLASLWEKSPNTQMEVKGRGIVTGLPTKILLERSDLYPVFKEISDEIVSTVSRALEVTPPELSGDVMTSGMFLTGGGALTTGIKEMLEERIRIPVVLADNPLDCAILGTIKGFEYWGETFDGFFTPRKDYYY